MSLVDIDNYARALAHKQYERSWQTAVPASSKPAHCSAMSDERDLLEMCDNAQRSVTLHSVAADWPAGRPVGWLAG